MAKQRVTGKNGAFSAPSGFNADFSTFSLESSQPVDDDTSYTDTGNGSSHSGSGTNDYALNSAGFLNSNAASTAPGMDDITAAGGAFTATAHTGCTEAMTGIIQSLRMDHAKRSGAIAYSMSAINDGDLTETWAVS